MSLSRHIHRLVLVLAVLSLLAYAAAGVEGTPLAALMIPLTVAAWWVTGPGSERAAPRYVVNLLLAVVCGYTVLRAMQASLSVRVFADFVTLLIPVKMLDRRKPRDTAQVISLSTFLVIGSILTDNTFETAMIMLVYVTAGAYTMMVFQLRAAEDAASHARPAPERSSAGLRRSLRGLTALGLAIGLPITASAFILMPRNPSVDAARAWGGAGTGQVTGFNDEIQLGRSGLISSSSEPVLDLEVTTPTGERIGSDGTAFYMRGAVLENYDPETGRWSADRGSRGDSVTRQPSSDSDRDFLWISRRPNEWDVEQTVTLRDSSERGTHLFAIWQPKQLHIRQRFAIDPQTSELRAPGGGGSIAYTVRSLRDNPEARSPNESVEQTREQRREIGFDMPAARELATSLIEPRGLSPDPNERSWADDATAAAALENSFTRRNYRYSLDQLAPPPGRDPIVWFLNESRTGHCEYFASGMAAMCRSIGINARVVTGYIVTDYIPGSRHYVVRASNAHAWVEVQVGPDAWRRYDPSPSADLQRLHERSQTLLAQLGGIYESIEYGWIRAVIGFDDDRRNTLLGDELADSSDSLMADLADRVDRAAEAPPETLLLAGGRGLIAFFSVAVLGYSAVIGVTAIPRLPWPRSLIMPFGAGGAGARRTERLAAEIDKTLRTIDAPRPAHRPFLTHLALLPELDAEPGPHDPRDPTGAGGAGGNLGEIPVGKVLADASRDLARARYATDPRDRDPDLLEEHIRRVRAARTNSGTA